MSLKQLNEKLAIKKLRLPTRSKYFKLNWNDRNNHNLFNRIQQRTNLSRKEIVEKIIRGIDKFKDDYDRNNQSYIIKFVKSEFYLVVVKFSDSILINTILSYNMKLRKDDTIFSINEAEKLFNIDLSEMYQDEELLNGSMGNLFIELNEDENGQDVIPFYYNIEL